jgi:tetratricopeptide (TPR) repeat protein/nitrate/TMAO reductase-like tetraheme cytochrome c subunit
MKFLALALFVFLASTAYLAAFDTPSIFYMSNVLVHVFGGVALAASGAWVLWRAPELRRYWPSALLLAIGVALGLYLVRIGNLREHRAILYVHIAVSILAVLPMSKRVRTISLALIGCVALIRGYERAFPDPSHRIANSLYVPTSMDEEGQGPHGPFWPSAAKTNTGGTIPSDFFMDSKLCGECHKDIYEQWQSSMHHFASFNNQFYRKSIEDMQTLQGTTQPSKWCAGCHDHAVLFNGRWEQPIAQQVNTPEAQNGLGCMSCHSISHVSGSVGNGGFTIEYPPLHALASSRNPWIRKLDEFLTFTDPEPHRKTFLKPFMRQDSAEFCSSCHKVHLDVPVNDYRWIRGFNDYDNWQASGVSGQGARSFYYPAQSSTCSDCHMPLVDSRDPGHRNGKVHNHRFAAANMAVAHVNGDEKQLRETEDFLKSGFLTVDIFAASPIEETKGALQMHRRAGEATPALSSTMAVGEEGDTSGPMYIREVGKVAAPLDTANVKLEPGSTVRMDVVVRTRKIGHFFPGGTVDAFDVWTELQGKDADGRIFFWSGMVEDGGKGPVERGAHFYRSYMLDGDGNMINKRNAWQARSVLYVRLIPPGAADTVHYRVKIPKDVTGPVTFTAKVNYRKFAHYYTQYAYSDRPNVSGPIQDRVPNVPIVTIAEKTTRLGLGKTEWTPAVAKADRERWNDWGIGMLLQGDLKGAEYAFQRVTEAEPEYADGWLNVARALIQEGETDAAKPYLGKALETNPNLGRIYFFRAMVEKADGDYDAALASLATVAQQYPRDRVVLNQIGRIHFLKREYKQALAALERVLAIDTEDLQAHYNLMLVYRGLGDEDKAQRAEKLFRRFKADESAQAITAKPRLLSPEDNNERQTIHDHESVPSFLLPEPARRGARLSTQRPVPGRDATGGD